jgi:hypothetical protein
MDPHGLYHKYKVNRLLYGEEIDAQIPQSRPSGSEPWHGLSIIEMNSTFLECTGKFYEEKGHGPFALFVTFGAVFGTLLSDSERLTRIISQVINGGWPEISFMILFLFPLPYFGWWHFKKEIRYTHCPIRFNRKTRKVHVFRWDGTVMTEDWDKIFFTLGGHGFTEMEIRGHRMAEDGYTVLETFGLPIHAPRGHPRLYSFWEFVRRYMEQGPEKLIGQVERIMPIADRRESFEHGFNRFYVTLPRGPISVLVALVMSFCRSIVMNIAKIPEWPPEVEAECQIEPDDPYILDAPPLEYWNKTRDPNEAPDYGNPSEYD